MGAVNHKLTAVYFTFCLNLGYTIKVQFPQNILNKLSDLPSKPGVYIMRGMGGHIVYIGKAVVLKNRIRQYFSNTQKELKVLAMVQAVQDFDYIITLTEKDALSLEANLIRKHKPRYNILLKDDKHAPYIRIDTRQTFPALEITRKVKNDGARYFGPYFFGVRVSEIVDVIKSAYRIRACGKNFTSAKRACLNHDIKLCLAPCQQKITGEAYAVALEKTMAFLTGKDSDAEKIITDKMTAAVETEEFERAIKYREQLAMLKKLKERIVSELENADKDLDAISFISEGLYAAASVVIVRSGKLMGVKNYPLSGIAQSQDATTQFITQYYSANNGDIPKEILLETPLDTQALSEYLNTLNGKKTHFSFPQKGIKKKLIAMAEENAKDSLVKSLERGERDFQMHEGANDRLAELLGLPALRRIECYDISHLQGANQVASGVVFVNGHAEKSQYRRYKIKSHTGNDDFKSMAEVLTRRLSHAGDERFGSLPDLIVIDGGKGQLSSAHAAMSASGIIVPMISLAKRDEEIFTLGNPNPIILPKESFVLKLLQRIRDEAHRFAVSHHRTLRSKKDKSSLENIAGVGPKKRQILLKAFNYSIPAIKAAHLETLAAVEGIDHRTAEAIVAYFKTQP